MTTMIDGSAISDATQPLERGDAAAIVPGTIPVGRSTPSATKTVIMDGPDDGVPIQPASARPPALEIGLRSPKIIVTLGPDTEDAEVLRSLLAAGVSAFRLDAACTGRELALKMVYALRSISTELRQSVSLLFDAGCVAANSDEGWAKVRFGLECGADWMAVSAKAGAGVLRQLRQFLADQKRHHIGILARLDSRCGDGNLGDVIDEADGILDAQGYLDAAQRPNWEGLAMRCRAARKPLILNAALSGGSAELASLVSLQPDALMLPGETGVGRSALWRVQELQSQLGLVECAARDEGQDRVPRVAQRDEAIASAVRQAEEEKADAVILFTQSGHEAVLCAALRPRHPRVFVFTSDTRLARRLILHYAIEPQVLTYTDPTRKTMSAAEKQLMDRNLLRRGARIILVTETRVEGRRVFAVQVRAAGEGGKAGEGSR